MFFFFFLIKPFPTILQTIGIQNSKGNKKEHQNDFREVRYNNLQTRFNNFQFTFYLFRSLSSLSFPYYFLHKSVYP